MVMKVPDSRLNLVISYLKSIGKSRLGELASISGNALWNLAQPLTIIVAVKLPGLDQENYIYGPGRQHNNLRNIIKEHGLEFPAKNNPSLPSYLSITTDEGKTICVSTIKHLGDPVGRIAAIGDDAGEGPLTLTEATWLCASQLGVRIHALLSPVGSSKVEILGRQLLSALKPDGVRILTIGAASGDEAWMSLYQDRDKVSVKEIERFPQEQAAAISDGEIIGENTLKYLWSNSDIGTGVWLSTQNGYYLALGFEDRRDFNPEITVKVKKFIDQKIKDDSAYLVKSFEKLKADFEKLVKSERAAAITETAVTINHEINNPLTAILGNTQLLLMSHDKLPADIVTKLETIERSAVKIRETTAKLMSIIEPVTSPYASGLEMIDIEKSKKKKQQ
jgi:hypothetical protein